MSTIRLPLLPLSLLLPVFAVGCGSGPDEPSGSVENVEQTGNAGTTTAGSTAGTSGTSGTATSGDGAGVDGSGTSGASGSSGAGNDSTGGSGGSTTGLAASGTAGSAGDANGASGSGNDTSGATSGESGTSGTLDPADLPPFSFFVTSLRAMQELSGSDLGFGGDLRFGETGPGAGLRGADKICEAIAERSMPGAGVKQWRAFLSASSGGADGGPVHARDRIGNGPWYDRAGRLLAEDLDALLAGNRPAGADRAIVDDFPNEDGIPNQAPDGLIPVDNHDVVTGSNAQGRYEPGSNTCEDWTSTTSGSDGGSGGGGSGGFWGGFPGFGGGSGPMLGHSWPAASGQHWIASHGSHSCAAGVNLNAFTGPGDGSSIGAGGGYGGIYCFALHP